MNIRLTAHLLLLLVLVSFCTAGKCANNRPGVITSGDLGTDNTLLFSHSVMVLEDLDNTLSVEGVYQAFSEELQSDTDTGRWQDFQTHQPARVSQEITLWVAVRIANDSDQVQHLFYRNTHTSVKDASIFLWRDGRLVSEEKFGTLHTSSDDDIRYHQFTYPLTVMPGDRVDLLLSVRHSNFPAVTVERGLLLTEREMALSENVFAGLNWFLVGALFLLSILSLFAAVRLRNGQFGLLSIISITAVAMQLDFQGYLAYYIWPQIIYLKTKSMILLSWGLMFCLTLFIQGFLSTQRTAPRFHKWVVAASVVFSSMCALGMVIRDGDQLLLVSATWVWLSQIFGLVVLAFMLWRRGSHAAGQLLLALVGFALIHAFSSIGYSFFEQMHHFNMLFASFSIVLLVLFLFMILFIELRQQKVERDMAIAESKAKTDFLARMSHEIRTPMNGVIGMAEVLAETDLSKMQQDYVSVIYNSGRTLLAVLNEILDFSKIAAGKMKIEWHEIDIIKAAEECVGLFIPQAREKRLELVCDIDPRMSPYWICDDTRFRQVVFNLLSNAIKFTESGEVVFSMSTMEESTGIQFSVTDTGIGISEQEQQRLFESFSQADVSTSRRYGGTGLGLAISKQLVYLMGGSLELDSQPGRGSIFTIKLPLSPGKVPAPDISINSDLQHKHILLVEDNDKTLATEIAQANRLGVEVDSTTSARQALKKISATQQGGRPYDLVLTDISMPDMDGLELAEQINLLPDPPPVVLLSASRDLPLDASTEHSCVIFATQKPLQVRGMKKILLRAFEGNQAPEEEKVPDRSRSIEIPGLRVLVAEDNQVNFKVAAAILRKFGHQAIHVGNGKHAISEYLQKNIEAPTPYFHVILMDCEMPDMDGFEATQKIRDLEKKYNVKPIPIIALTAHVMDEVVTQCYEAGMNDYLSKPIQMDVLQNKLSAFSNPTTQK